jgi:RHS repeat-associated protein
MLVQFHAEYDAFGAVTEYGAGYGDTLKYTAREFDADTGLQYNRARWYDNSVGRWLSEDPIGFAAGDQNLYRYVSNFATGATDPSGLWSWSGAFGGGLTGAGAGASTGAIVGGIAGLGVGSLPGAGVGAIGGAVFGGVGGFIVGGIYGEDAASKLYDKPKENLTTGELFGAGALIGLPSGLIGGLLGPWAIYGGIPVGAAFATTTYFRIFLYTGTGGFWIKYAEWLSHQNRTNPGWLNRWILISMDKWKETPPTSMFP